MGKPFYYFGKCLFTLGRPFFPTKVIGKENIRESGKVIYASNHLSAIDIPLIQVHCPGYRRYIGKKEYGEKCVRRFLLSHFGVIFIDRDKPELSVMRQIFKVLDGGQIVIFPEGTRNHGDPKEMLELKTGLAVFAAKSGAPVLPVVIWRKPRILRKNYMYIGEPVVLSNRPRSNRGRAKIPTRGRYKKPKRQMIKIIVDVFSGDNPQDLIKGTADAVNACPDVHIIMPGDPEYLEAELADCSFDRSRLEILPASEIIGNDESPTAAMRQKKDSSLVRGATLLKNDPEAGGMISAGSTGAILCCGIFIVGRIRGIDRPALAPLLPTADGGHVCLIDCGANADCRPQYLAQFALLGTGVMQSIYGIEKPRVALVNVGEEDHKGSALTNEAANLIKRMPVNFVGNMEAQRPAQKHRGYSAAVFGETARSCPPQRSRGNGPRVCGTFRRGRHGKSRL